MLTLDCTVCSIRHAPRREWNLTRSRRLRRFSRRVGRSAHACRETSVHRQLESAQYSVSGSRNCARPFRSGNTNTRMGFFLAVHR